MDKQKLLVIIGNVSYDSNIYPSGEKRRIVSGAAYIVALAASLFSKNIGIVTKLGSDFNLKYLQELQIDLSGVQLIKNAKTSRFYHTYKNNDQSQRIFKGELTIGKTLSPNDIPKHFLSAKYIHVATMPPIQQKIFVDFLRKHSKANISIDTLEDYILEWRDIVFDNFKKVDIAFVDKREHELLETIKLKKVEIVIKKGKDGADDIYYKNYKKRVIHADAPIVAKVIDKTGAGDVLAGVFLTLIAKGKSRAYALSNAVKIASISITNFGVRHLLEYTNERI